MFETKFPIDGDCPFIVWMGIRRNHWCPIIEQGLHSHGDERRSMSDTDHVGLTNKLIDPPGSLGKIGEMVLFPSMHCIILHEGKRTRSA